MPTDVEVLLFDGFDELDAVGPHEVLANGARAGADLTVRTVTHGRADSVVASHGLEVVPDGELGDPDLLVVPGGGWTTEGGVRAVVDDGTLPDAVAAHHARGGALASVCTGAMVLAASGVLDGRPATTHHAAHADLEAVAERVDARVVDDGDVVTAGGVTAGIDLAFHLLERDHGADVAEQVAHEMEYERRGEVHRAGD
jgi:transcriptional regulator GlxA family with amidase domain